MYRTRLKVQEKNNKNVNSKCKQTLPVLHFSLLLIFSQYRNFFIRKQKNVKIGQKIPKTKNNKIFAVSILTRDSQKIKNVFFFFPFSFLTVCGYDFVKEFSGRMYTRTLFSLPSQFHLLLAFKTKFSLYFYYYALNIVY